MEKYRTQWQPSPGGNARRDRIFWIFLLFALGLGTYLRLKQYPGQLLLDDEWHAVHQLLKGRSPAELFLTLGQADYSIPLGLLYWLESRWFGLSEFAMRWPMLLAGLATLGLFTGFAYRRFGVAVASVFAFALALSPMLIIYTHTARPYSLTLLLAYLSLYQFYRYRESSSGAGLWALGYCVTAALCIWLHPVTGPFVVAPFVLEGLRTLLRKRWADLFRLVWLAVPAAIAVLVLILPPLLSDSDALAIKAGMGVLERGTIGGVWFMWLGTPSNLCVAAFLFLAVLGVRPLMRASPLAASAAVGLTLTLLVLLLTQPAWVQHSLTLGRYLLPAVPLLLLAAAMGVVLVWQWLHGRSAVLRLTFAGGLLAVAALYLAVSPVRQLAATPNSHITHIRYQFDFRDKHNRMIDYQERIPFSSFWRSQGDHPPNSRTLAVAPFWFESFNWDGIRWQDLSGQRIVPAYLTGYCVEKRYGEVPAGGGFRFRNAFYLNSLDAPAVAIPDWLVYIKPFAGFLSGSEGRLVGAELMHCIGQLRADLGEPDYEDDTLLAYDLKRRAAAGN